MADTGTLFGEVDKASRPPGAVGSGVQRRAPGRAYLELARWFAPQRIASSARRTETVAVIDALDARPNLGRGEREYRDALAALVAEYDFRREHGHATPPTAERPRVVLSRLMRERGIEQRTLGQAVGISRGHVSMLSRGRRPITPELAVRLAAYFGVPVSVLSPAG